MRGRGSYLSRAWGNLGPFAPAIAVEQAIIYTPQRLDETFNYADGELSTVAPAVWAKNGAGALNVASNDITSGAVVANGVTYGHSTTLNAALRRVLTIYDLTFATATLAAHSFTIGLDALTQTGSPGAYLLFQASQFSGATMALNTSSGSTSYRVGNAVDGGFTTFGTCKLALEADGTARAYYAGAQVSQRTGTAATGARFCTLAHNRAAGDANTPSVTFSRIVLQGYA